MATAGEVPCQVCRTSLLLVFLIGTYLVFGASVFFKLEGDSAINALDAITSPEAVIGRETLIQRLGEALRPSKSNWTELARQILMDDDASQLKYQHWEFRSALELCLSIVTTIGYGNITPKTPGGRIFCCVYAIFGIPLFLIVISHFGHIVAEKLRTCGLALISHGRRCVNSRKSAKLNFVGELGGWQENWSFKNGTSSSSTTVLAKESGETSYTYDLEPDPQPVAQHAYRHKDFRVMNSTISKKMRIKTTKGRSPLPVQEIAAWWRTYPPAGENMIESKLNRVPDGATGPSLTNGGAQTLHDTSGQAIEIRQDLQAAHSLTEPVETRIIRDPIFGDDGSNRAQQDKITQTTLKDENEGHVFYMLIVVMVLFLVVWVAVLTQLDTDWTLVDCIYFCIVSITTIGFGDLLIPIVNNDDSFRSNIQPLVASVFLMSGLVLLSASFNIAQLEIKSFAYKLFDMVLSLCQCNRCRRCNRGAET